MKHLARLLSCTLLALITIFAAGGGTSAVMAAEEGILVGRIAFIDGKLFRYVEEEKDWVLTVNDAPFGLEDALYSGEEAKAEIILPNRTWVRIGESTQLQIIALKPGATTVDVAAGLARLYNKNRDAIIKVTTPFGYVVAPGGTVFDLYVGDDSLEVIAIEGDVDFVHEGNTARYSLRQGGASIIADKWQSTRGNGTVDRDWDDWNGERDNLWVQRLRARGSSSDLLPEPIREDAYVLEEHGRWERVHYEGAYRDMWRPLRVEPGWRPFTVGRWSVYYGDNCWIPSEPFGYVTHHYGSWVYIDSFRAWYWSPPVVRVAPAKSSFFIGFDWYPGRVGWFHSGPSIGWVPLAPHEPYYGYRPWGHRTVVVHQTTITTVNISQYRYLDEAVVIHRDHFYRGNRYTPFIERNVNKTFIVNNYRPTTVINNTVINNYNIDPSRFTLTDERINRKPHTTVIKRITENQKGVGEADRLNRGTILQELTQITAASEPPAAAKIRGPMLTAKVVGADSVTKPLDTDGSRQKVIKPKERERRIADNDTLLKEVPGQQPTAVQAPIDRNERRHMQAAREARNELMSASQAAAGLTDPPPDGKQRGWRNQGGTEQVAGGGEEKGERVPRSPREERREKKEQAIDQPAARVMPSERRPPRLDRVKEPVDQGNTEQVAGGGEEKGERVPRSPREERREKKEQAIDQPSTRVMPSERRPPRLDRVKEPVDQGNTEQVAGSGEETGERVPRSPREERREKKEQAIDQPSTRVMPSERRPPRLERTKEQVGQGNTEQVAGTGEETGERVPRSPREERREKKEQAVDQPSTRVMPSERRPPRLDRTKEPVDQGGIEQGSVAEVQKQKIQKRPEEDIQRRQQVQEQQRQEQEAQRRQQVQEQQRQEQEAQRLQQKQEQQRQEQEVQRRQQKQEQQRQEQEVQRRQQVQEQQRQEQEVQRRQQKQEQKQQEQEVQRRQQKQEQEIERRRQEKEVQQRQPREEQPQEAQPQGAQQMKKKKKGPTQEELEQQLLQQQQAPKQ